MPAHEKKSCPRCDALFECKAGSILQCQCQTVYLTPEHLEYINRHYTDCLCAACLAAVCTEYENRQLHKKLKQIVRNKWR